jgi:hypothetical protein
VVVVRCEGINISGNFFRSKCKSLMQGKWCMMYIYLKVNDTSSRSLKEGY